MNSQAPTFLSLRGGAIETSFCGLPAPLFNLAAATKTPESPADFEAGFSAFLEWAQPYGLPFIVYIPHETMGEHLPAVDAYLKSIGFNPFMPLTGMEADALTAPARPLPEGTMCTEASHDDIGDLVLRVNEAAYHMVMGEPGMFPMEAPSWWEPADRTATVVRNADETMSASVVFEAGETSYVALVATRPGFERRGLAELAFRDALGRAQAAGAPQRTYLHATAAGRPVYERMGYKPTSVATIYAAM